VVANARTNWGEMTRFVQRANAGEVEQGDVDLLIRVDVDAPRTLATTTSRLHGYDTWKVTGW